MRIRITRHLHDTVVAFETAVGSAQGRWRGSAIQVPSEHRVEFTLPELTPGRNTTIVDAGPHALWLDSHGVHFRGHVEHVDDDGVLFLRLAPDCLIMIEAPPGTVHRDTWIEACFPMEDVQLHPHS